jgi:glycosyltransferase involved in cell wall biosynthesis
VVDGVPVSRIPVDVTRAASKIRASRHMIAELVRVVPRADIVHVHGYSQKNVLVAAAARLFRVPLVLSLHTSGFDEPATIAGRGRLARWALNAADLYLSVSPALVDACVAAGLPAGKIRHVPNGVDLDRFRTATADERASLRASLGIAAGRPVILFVGFFSREKQPAVLFDAWLRLQARSGCTRGASESCRYRPRTCRPS